MVFELMAGSFSGWNWECRTLYRLEEIGEEKKKRFKFKGKCHHYQSCYAAPFKFFSAVVTRFHSICLMNSVIFIMLESRNALMMWCVFFVKTSKLMGENGVRKSSRKPWAARRALKSRYFCRICARKYLIDNKMLHSSFSRIKIHFQPLYISKDGSFNDVYTYYVPS